MTGTPGSPERQADVSVTGHVFKPAELAPPDVSTLKVPKGFRVEKFAENLGNARILAVSPEGNVYLTRREQGDVLMLKVGSNGLPTGKAERVASRAGMHGITFHDGKVYLATIHEIFRGDVLPSGEFGDLEMIVHDLPDAGQHHTRTLQFAPDGMLYVSVASTANETNEPNPESATVLRLSPDGKRRAIFASGLRDVVGWGWHPQTGELWAMDHGIDWLGDDLQPEELNHLEKGKFYGWPYFFADNKKNPHIDPPAGSEKSDWLKIATPMVMGYTAHASPMQLSFYSASQFPDEYRGDAFISMRGSWNRKPASGYEVVRIHFVEGKPVKFESFLSGFLTEKGESARLCGNVVAKDGSLLVSDDRNGVIYRVSYTSGSTAPAVTAKEEPRNVVEPDPSGSIAITAFETKADKKLAVSSSAFSDGAPIPAKYSAYEQDASVPLQWSAGPAETKTYVVILDDPDAAPPPSPYNHWVIWNIPGTVTTLREGFQSAVRVQEPKGVSQGKNSAGKPGYSGPRPPLGDPAHHYHFQVFALDSRLELPLGADRKALLTAMNGHVVAKGELIGTFARPEKPSKP